MKKHTFVLIALLFLVFSLSCAAQSNPISIMGIPFRGSIVNFHGQMLAKGFEYQGEFTDFRAYKGMYDGRKSSVLVFFDESTNNVKRAEVRIHCKTKEDAIILYGEYRPIIEDRYEPYLRNSSTRNGTESVSFYTRPTVISMSVEYSDVDYSFPYKLLIAFINK